MTCLQQTFDKKSLSQPKIWLMRQAGRYLPEYRNIRKNFSSFMEFCSDSEIAAEVTLQPIERFSFDAAIIFSDILTIPQAMGQDVDFIPQQGPVLSTILDWSNFLELQEMQRPETLESTYRALKLSRQSLDHKKSLFGFAGAPWTLMTYMLGKKRSDYSNVLLFAKENPKWFLSLQDRLVEVITDHLIKQIKAGADIVQLFDSWAAVVPKNKLNQWVIDPIVRIVNKFHQHTESPIIVFAKGAEHCYSHIADKVKLKQKLGFSLSSEAALTKPVENYVLQGGLNPETLVEGGEKLTRETLEILQTHANKPYIFNLGHGILPQTPVDNVRQLLEIVRAYEPGGIYDKQENSCGAV